MKKCLILVCFCLLLTGCAAVETVETVADDWLAPVAAPLGQIDLRLPASASVETSIGDDQGRLYLCDGYDLTVQTLARGDLDRTCKALCGLQSDRVTMIGQDDGEQKRWDWAWTCVGEEGDCIGRAAVIDDGNYHYCVSVLAPAGEAGSLEAEWAAVFASFAVR